MSVVFCDIDSPRSSVSRGDTHVYTHATCDPAPLESHLTESERERAGRFRLARVRDQFICARGQIRALLGHYLNVEPRSVPLLYAEGGKPYLPEEFPLHFNVSHTDGLAVFALSRALVGVDVERCRDIPDADGLVSRFFTQRECAQYSTIEPAARPAAFLRAWTRKEAVLKAIGRGVQSLDCCDVAFGADEPPALVSLDGDMNAINEWQLFTWEPAAGYLAAGAVRRTM